MTKRDYQKLAAPFLKSPKKRKALIVSDLVLTGLVYLAYPILISVLFFLRDERFWRCFFVPAVSFLFVSGLRKLIDAPRPYEKLHFRPLLHKEKHGESFPSRHVFSVFVISFAFYCTCLPVGIALTVLGVLLAAVRVVGGVHFPKDVLAGAGIGILAGVLGFFVF